MARFRRVWKMCDLVFGSLVWCVCVMECGVSARANERAFPRAGRADPVSGVCMARSQAIQIERCTQTEDAAATETNTRFVTVLQVCAWVGVSMPRCVGACGRVCTCRRCSVCGKVFPLAAQRFKHEQSCVRTATWPKRSHKKKGSGGRIVQRLVGVHIVLKGTPRMWTEVHEGPYLPPTMHPSDLVLGQDLPEALQVRVCVAWMDVLRHCAWRRGAM